MQAQSLDREDPLEEGMATYSIMIITNHDCPDQKPLKSLALTFQEWVLSFDQEGQPHKDYVIALTCAFSKDLENKSTL